MDNEILHENSQLWLPCVLIIDSLDYSNIVWLHLCFKANKDLIMQWVPSGFCFPNKVNFFFFFLPRMCAWCHIPVLLYQHFNQFPCSRCVSICQAIFFWQAVIEDLGNETNGLMSNNYIFGMHTLFWACCWGLCGHWLLVLATIDWRLSLCLGPCAKHLTWIISCNFHNY